MRTLLVLAAASVAATPPLHKLILRPVQVGPGYTLHVPRDGTGVFNRVTMDLCGRSGYPSERLRTHRLQVDYVHGTSPLRLSNEVVLYRPGGAAQAMREAASHALHCPHQPIDTGQQGLPPLTFTITRLHDSKLLKGALAVRVRVTGTIRGMRVDQTSYAVYQRRGNILSGVYSSGPNTPGQQRFCLRAAEQSAKNLRNGGAPTGPTA